MERTGPIAAGTEDGGKRTMSQGMHMTSRSWGSPQLTASNSRTLSSTTGRNWILPTAHMGLEWDPPREPPETNASLFVPSYPLSETHARLPTYSTIK